MRSPIYSFHGTKERDLVLPDINKWLYVVHTVKNGERKTGSNNYSNWFYSKASAYEYISSRRFNPSDRRRNRSLILKVYGIVSLQDLSARSNDSLWFLFDVVNGTKSNGGYLWWYENRKDALRRIAKHRKNPLSADLFGPFLYGVTNGNVD